MSIQKTFKCIFESPFVHFSIGFLILLNVATFAFETVPEYKAQYGHLFNQFSNVVLWIFAAEVLGRMIGNGSAYFKDGWNIMDVTIVVLSFVFVGSFVQLFRVARIFWLIRFFTISPHFRRLVGSVTKAIPHVIAIIGMLILVIFVASIIGTIEFSITNPETFGSVKTAMGTITRTMFFSDTWAERYEELAKHHDMAWAFIFPVMIILNIFLLQLVLGVLVTALQSQFDQEEKEEKHRFLEKFFKNQHKEEENPLSPDTKAILKKIADLEQRIDGKKDRTGDKK